MTVLRNLMMTEAPFYVVSFNYGDIPDQHVKRGKLAGRPVDPCREDYDFTGWFVDGVLFDFSEPVTGNLVLTAGWNLKTFIVTFDTTGGDPVNSQVVAYGSLAVSVTPVRACYDFTGWTLDGVAFDFNTPVTENLTLVATWEKELFTQSGTASIVALTYSSDGAVTICGIHVTFKVPFASAPEIAVNNVVVPNATYDFTSNTRYTSYKTPTDFGQTTGYTRIFLGSSGMTSGTVSWTATGYRA